MYLHRRSVIKIGALNRRINGTMKSPEFAGDDERSCHMLGLPVFSGKKEKPADGERQYGNKENAGGEPSSRRDSQANAHQMTVNVDEKILFRHLRANCYVTRSHG
ncbi:MAG: hypothetical protein WCB53_21725 [Terriglobales bacterium]